MTRDLAPAFNKRYGENFFKEGIDAYLDAFELRLEKHLIDLLRDPDIHASVKKDRYSLPYTREVANKAKVASYINDAFFYYNIMKSAVKELLIDNVHKLRFYITTGISENSFKVSTAGLPDSTFKTDSFTMHEFYIAYKFRCHPH